MLFEKEEDNNFEERAVALQLCSWYRHKLVKARLNQSPEVATWVTTKRTFFLQQLHRGYLLLQDKITRDSQRSELFKNFPTYDPDLFMPLYQLALAAATFTFEGCLDTQGLEGVVQMMSMPHLHPMLSSALQVLQELSTNSSTTTLFEVCSNKLHLFLPQVE
jgi:hypothetical protein